MSGPPLDALSELTGTAAPPRDNGELVFAAPWEGRAMAIAVATIDRLGVPWTEFQRRLITAITAEPERPYYESWAEALEQLLIDHEVTTAAAIEAASISSTSPAPPTAS